jgi:exonuclease III
MGISETKFSQEKVEYAFKDQDDFKTFHSCNEDTPRGTGVSMLVYKSLAKNVHRVEKWEGRILALHFKFKGTKKLCIIQVYLPSEKQESEKLQKCIQKIVGKEKHEGSNVIVMGDFNAVNNPMLDRSSLKSSWEPEAPIFPFLEDLGYLDNHKQW